MKKFSCFYGSCDGIGLRTARRVYFGTTQGNEEFEGARAGAEKVREGEKKSYEQEARELKAVYRDNWNRVQNDVKGWAGSDNPKIKKLAEQCREALASLDDPNKVQNLSRKEVNNFVNRITEIIRKFYTEVNMARYAKPGAPEEREGEETLDQAFKRYLQVYSACAGTIEGWKEELKTGRIGSTPLVTPGGPEGQIQKLDSFLKGLEPYSGLKQDSFKDISGVDRTIDAINKAFEPAGAYYNNLLKENRDIRIARREKEKKERQA